MIFTWPRSSRPPDSRARKLSEQRVRQLLAAGKIAGAIRVGARLAAV